MNKAIILGWAIAGIALNPVGAFAAQDSKYPAADFQPKVLFVDEAAVKAAAATSVSSGSTEQDSKYPAANFQPKVIFLAEDAASSAKTESKPAVVHDPKYPAASFEPKVIYP
jgi:hypothetical protein